MASKDYDEEKAKRLMKKFGSWLTIWWVPTQPIKGNVGAKVGMIIKENGIGVIGIEIMIRETWNGSMIGMCLPIIKKKAKSSISLF